MLPNCNLLYHFKVDMGERLVRQHAFMDLEAMGAQYEGLLFPPEAPTTPSGSILRLIEESLITQTILSYPPSDSLKLRSTSWLDGVRGVSALSVYLFHSMGCWTSIVPAWHSDDS